MPSTIIANIKEAVIFFKTVIRRFFVRTIHKSDTFLKSDERILKESEFVDQVLNEAKETIHKYLKTR
jgi:hypothetical protein